MRPRVHVIVSNHPISGMNRPVLIDPTLCRFGRFEREMDIRVPEEIGRLEILRIHKNNKIPEEIVDLEAIAS